MEFKVINILGFVMVVAFVFVFLMFFKYVSVGEHISIESYTDEKGNVDFDEMFWNIGIFIAIIMGFASFCMGGLDLLFNKTKKEKKL